MATTDADRQSQQTTHDRCDQCGDVVDPAWGRDVPVHYGDIGHVCLHCWYLIKRGSTIDIDSDIVWHTATAVDLTPHRLVCWLAGEDMLGHDIELNVFQEAVVAEAQMRQQLRDTALPAE